MQSANVNPVDVPVKGNVQMFHASESRETRLAFPVLAHLQGSPARNSSSAENFPSATFATAQQIQREVAMGKRPAQEAEPRAVQDARHIKRQRVENSVERNSPRPNAPAVEEVSGPRQLQKALVFDKNAVPAFRSGMICLEVIVCVNRADGY